MSFKKLFLPVGLVVAIVAALVVPGPGVAMQEAGMIGVLVMIIFLVNGWEFRLAETRVDGKLVGAFALSAALSLLAGPFVGLWTGHLFGGDPRLLAGLVVMSAVPVTLSSAIVMSELSGGNRAWALLMTIGLNLVGIFTLPFMLKLTLGSTGQIDISVVALLLKLIKLVLLPFLVGMVLRRLAGARVGKVPLLSYVPSTCVILTVFVGFAASRDLLVGLPLVQYPPIAGAAFMVHAVLMVTAFGLARLIRLETAERNTFVFISAQKTLPLAVGVIAIIAPTNALALVPCLLFHFMQLFFDSFLATRLAR